MSTNDELHVGEIFFPTIIIDPESEEYKSLKPLHQRLLKTRIKRGPGKGRVRVAWLDQLAQLFRTPGQ